VCGFVNFQMKCMCLYVRATVKSSSRMTKRSNSKKIWR